MNIAINSKSILKSAAVVTALGVLGSAAWAIGEVTELRPALIKELNVVIAQAQQQAQSLQWVELDNLENKYEKSILSDQEKQKRCFIAYQLQAFYVKDCTWPLPPPPPPPQ